MDILLKHGVELNSVDEVSMSPLMLAALQHLIEVLEVLNKYGVYLAQRAECGMTEFHIAALTHIPYSEETVRLLCEAVELIDIKDERGV